MPTILASPGVNEKVRYDLFGGVRSSRLTLVEEKREGVSTGVVYARGVFGKADELTGNNRIYPRRILEREIAALQKQIAEHGGVVGELDHPLDGKTQLKRVSHVLTKVEMTPEGEVIGEAKILDTEFGKTLKEIVKSGVVVGVSSRGTGSVMINEHGQEVVQEDFHLVTFDFVAEPASASAYPTYMMESKDRQGGLKMQDEKMTLEELKEKHADLVAALLKEADERWAKRIQEVREEERNAAKDELREEFKKEFLSQLGEMRGEIEKSVRSEILSDPNVARAQKALETLKTVLRPLITEEDVAAVVKDKEAEAEAEKKKAAEAEKEKEAALAQAAELKEEMAKLREQMDEVASVAREMGYKLFLERAMEGMTAEEKDLMKSLVGDLRQIPSNEVLRKKVEEAREKTTKLMAEKVANAGKVRGTVEEIEREVSKLEMENKALREQGRKLTEGLEKSMAVAKQLGLKAYLEKKIADHPRRLEIKKILESRGFSSKEEVDRVVNQLTEERRPSEEFRRLREKMARGIGRTAKDEETSRSPRQSPVPGVPVEELRRLAGVEK